MSKETSSTQTQIPRFDLLKFGFYSFAALGLASCQTQDRALLAQNPPVVSNFDQAHCVFYPPNTPAEKNPLTYLSIPKVMAPGPDGFLAHFTSPERPNTDIIGIFLEPGALAKNRSIPFRSNSDQLLVNATISTDSGEVIYEATTIRPGGVIAEYKGCYQKVISLNSPLAFLLLLEDRKITELALVEK